MQRDRHGASGMDVACAEDSRSVREFAELAFKMGGYCIRWEGSGVNEVGIDQTGTVRVVVDPKYYRPTEVDLLLGNPERAVQDLGWNPNKTSFEELVREMVSSDVGRQ